jgi:hypothetical protein
MAEAAKRTTFLRKKCSPGDFPGDEQSRPDDVLPPELTQALLHDE